MSQHHCTPSWAVAFFMRPHAHPCGSRNKPNEMFFDRPRRISVFCLASDTRDGYDAGSANPGKRRVSKPKVKPTKCPPRRAGRDGAGWSDQQDKNCCLRRGRVGCVKKRLDVDVTTFACLPGKEREAFTHCIALV